MANEPPDNIVQTKDGLPRLTRVANEILGLIDGHRCTMTEFELIIADLAEYHRHCEEQLAELAALDSPNMV